MMKSLLAMFCAVVLLGLLYGVCGLFAALFFGVLSLAATPAMAAAAYLVPEPLNAVDIFLDFISSYSFLA